MPVAAILDIEPGLWRRSLREAHRVLVLNEDPGWRFDHFVNTDLAQPIWMQRARASRQIGQHLFLDLSR
jgi:hypothetical protein